MATSFNGRAASGTPGPLEVLVATSLDGLPAVRADWLCVRARRGITTPNTDPDCFEKTLPALGPGVRPYVAVFRNGLGPRAIVIGRIVERPVLCRWGYLNFRTPRLRCLEIVYGGLITDGDRSACAAVAHHLRGLLETGVVEHMMINHLDLSDPMYAEVSGRGAIHEIIEPHWITRAVPGSFEQTMWHHKSKTRRNLRRLDKKLMEHFGGDATLRIYTRPEEVGSFLTDAADISKHTYQAGLGAAVMDDPKWRTILDALAQGSYFQSYVLVAGGRPIAYQQGSRSKDVLILGPTGYLPQYRSLSPGTVLYIRILKHLCDEGFTVCDWGFGDADYKRINATEYWKETTLNFYGRGLRPGIARILDVSVLAAARLTGRAAESVGLADRIKRRWRSRLSADAPNGSDPAAAGPSVAAIRRSPTPERASALASMPLARAERPSVEVAISHADVEATRSDWLSLRKRHGVATPNSDPDRYLAALRAMGDDVQPHVSIFRDGGAVRALVVGRTTRRRIRCDFGYARLSTPSLRCLDVVYGGLITDKSPATAERVLTHFESLLAQGRVDCVMINHLPVEHELQASLSMGGENLRAGVANPASLHWRFSLVPGSYEETTQHFSRKHRYNLRRTDRLLVERFSGDVNVRCFQREDQIEEFVAGAAQIAGKSYQAALGGGFSDTPLWRAIVQCEARLGRWRSYVLECAGEPIAYQLGVVYGETYFLEATGHLTDYESFSPGTVLLLRVIQDLCEARLSRIDYGFGDAEYKRIYGTESSAERTLRVYGRRVRPSVARIMDVGTLAASGLAKRFGRSVGVLEKVKKKWRAGLNR
ncbi:MAG: GNAT family N-acetyltransferase [Planctomycetes bacterium]|nr:GNAT family N-acetyltransferase [Planctomycetota bacterium]